MNHDLLSFKELARQSRDQNMNQLLCTLFTLTLHDAWFKRHQINTQITHVQKVISKYRKFLSAEGIETQTSPLYEAQSALEFWKSSQNADLRRYISEINELDIALLVENLEYFIEVSKCSIEGREPINLHKISEYLNGIFPAQEYIENNVFQKQELNEGLYINLSDKNEWEKEYLFCIDLYGNPMYPEQMPSMPIPLNNLSVYEKEYFWKQVFNRSYDLLIKEESLVYHIACILRAGYELGDDALEFAVHMYLKHRERIIADISKYHFIETVYHYNVVLAFQLYLSESARHAALDNEVYSMLIDDLRSSAKKIPVYNYTQIAPFALSPHVVFESVVHAQTKEQKFGASLVLCYVYKLEKTDNSPFDIEIEQDGEDHEVEDYDAFKCRAFGLENHEIFEGFEAKRELLFETVLQRLILLNRIDPSLHGPQSIKQIRKTIRQAQNIVVELTQRLTNEYIDLIDLSILQLLAYAYFSPQETDEYKAFMQYATDFAAQKYRNSRKGRIKQLKEDFALWGLEIDSNYFEISEYLGDIDFVDMYALSLLVSDRPQDALDVLLQYTDINYEEIIRKGLKNIFNIPEESSVATEIAQYSVEALVFRRNMLLVLAYLTLERYPEAISIFETTWFDAADSILGQSADEAMKTLQKIHASYSSKEQWYTHMHHLSSEAHKDDNHENIYTNITCGDITSCFFNLKQASTDERNAHSTELVKLIMYHVFSPKHIIPNITSAN